MRYVLGLDAGQTSAVAAVSDEFGRVRATAYSGPLRPSGEPGATEANRRALHDAVTPVAARVPHVAACYLSLTTAIGEAKQLMAELLPGVPIQAETDAVSVRASAFDGPGLSLIAGTGSVCLATGEDGSRLASGGWGWFLGDRGSAFRMGHEALQEACLYEDGISGAEQLHREVVGFLGLKNMREAYGRVNRGDLPRWRVASVAREVARLAEAGEPAAQRICDEAAQALSELVLATWRGATDGLPTPCPVALGGAVLTPGGPVHERLTRRLASVRELDVITPDLEPVAGSLLLALQLAGIPTEGARENLRSARAQLRKREIND